MKDSLLKSLWKRWKDLFLGLFLILGPAPWHRKVTCIPSTLWKIDSPALSHWGQWLPHVSVPMHPPGLGSAGTKQPRKVEGFIHKSRELQEDAIGGQLMVSLLYRMIKSTKLLAWHKTHLTAVYIENIFFHLSFIFLFFFKLIVDFCPTLQNWMGNMKTGISLREIFCWI